VTSILSLQEMTGKHWERVNAALYRGGLVVLPADTVYGLACLATIPEAVERIYEVKGRSHDKPLALMFTSVKEVFGVIADLPEAIKAALEALLRGPVTAIIPFEDGTGGIHARGAGGIGIRIIPPPMGEIYRLMAGPLVVTSANLSGQPDASLVSDIPVSVLEACDFVIDGGRSGHRRPSTVVDLRPLAAGAAPVVLREGALARRVIEERFGRRQGA